MTNPTVSVIVPARNEEDCLALCLESLVTQAGIEFEVIVVDDASTDRTAEIARSLAEIPESSTDGKGTTFSRADMSDILTSPGYHTLANDTPASKSEGEANGTAEELALSLSKGRARPEIHNALQPRVTLISAPPLPENWTGKNNAISAGGKIATGKWLLFTDADTFHKPGSLARAIAEAEEHGASLLSYSPEQEVRTFWEKAVMPVIFAELATTYPPKKVNDPASPIAAANGQYLLISREAYDGVGGHTKIANDLLEDVALARLVKSSGRKIFFRYGGDAVRTRMYRSWPQMKEGWTKNLTLLFARPRALAILRGMELILILANAIAGTLGLFTKRYEAAAICWAIALVLATAALIRIRRAHFSLASNFLALCGLGLFSYLLLRSSALHGGSGVNWKGRRYASLTGNIKGARR